MIKTFFILIIIMNNYTIDKCNNTYTRHKNYYYNKLLKQLSNYYNNNNILLLNSGHQANMIVLYILILKFNNKENAFNSNINILYYSDLYYESKQILFFLQDFYNVKLYEFDYNDNIILDNIKNDINILFIESCSNPYGNIFNFENINNIKNNYNNIYIICDNTWLTHKIFNPLDYNIDIVTSSLTKHYSCNTVICGFCIIKNIELFNFLELYIRISGIHISIYSIKNIIKISKNTNNVIIKLSNMTKKIITYLNQKNIIICHPMINNFYLANKFFKNNLYPSTFLIGFKKEIPNLKLLIEKFTILKIEISFCSYYSKLDPFIYNKDNISYIRLSLGYNDSYTTIIDGINELLLILNSDNLYKLSI